MRTLIDTAKKVRIADVRPGGTFRLKESDVLEHVRIDTRSPFLAAREGCVYSLLGGTVVEHGGGDTGFVLGMNRL